MKRIKTILSAAVIAAAMVTSFLAMGAKYQTTASADTLCEHEYVVTTVSADCTHSGYTLHYCKRCGYEYTDNYTEKTGHNYIPKLVSVTGESGYIEYTCLNCGDKYTAECLNSSGHNYSFIKTEPTCISYGYILHECSSCGDKYITDYVLPAGHEYEDITVEVTAESKGYIKHVCKNCSYSYISDILPNEDKKKDNPSSFETPDEQPEIPTEHEHSYLLTFSIEENDKILLLEYSCGCGDKRTEELTASFISETGETYDFNPDNLGVVDYGLLSGRYSLTMTDKDNNILMEWEVTAEEETPINPDTPTENDEEKENEDKKEKSGISASGFLIGLIVALIIAGAAVVFIIMKNKKSKTNQKTGE